MTTTVKLDTRELDRIAQGLGVKRDKVVENLAFEIERSAKQKAPYRTGALKNSIHTRTKHGSTGAGFQPTGKRLMEEIPSPSGKIIAIVGSGMSYAAYQEFGTYKMAAHPYLGPAVEEKAKKLNSGEMWQELFK